MQGLDVHVTGEVRLSFEELAALLAAIFMRNDVSPEVARLLAENCTSCERDGSVSHGIFRIPGYISSLNARWVDGRATPRLHTNGPAFLRVDAMNGFAQPAWRAARPLLADMVDRCGVAVLAIRNSHHFSALWPDLEPYADAGLVCLTMVTGLCCVAPHSGKSAIFGTNPIAFATPVAGASPLIFDFATSAMSNRDVRLAAQGKESVPFGTGIDQLGNATDDPAKILHGGALLPFGGHKGSALSMMVEIMASALTGGQFSSEVNFNGYPGAETPRTGQIAIIINPQFSGNSSFANRVGALIDLAKRSGQERLPSDRRYRTRAVSEAYGIPLTAEQYSHLQSYLS